MSSPPSSSTELLQPLAESHAAMWLMQWLQGVSVGDLADLVRRDVDLAAQLPAELPLAGPVRQWAVAALRQAGPDTYERIRLRIASQMPEHAALLGLDFARPWYYRTMDRLRERLLASSGVGGGP